MRAGTFSFRPGIVPTLGAIAVIALTLWLGRWQVHRGDEKQARQDLYETRMRDAPVRLTGAGASADALLYRRVRASGEWVGAGQVFVDNQVHDGRAGYFVVTPLRIAGGGDTVLVNRGWIARAPDYPRPPGVSVPAGTVEVSGLATLPPKRFLELSADTVSGPVWQNLSIERYRERMRIDVMPVLVLADAPGAGLAAVAETPDAGVARHREYALTWFSLAATTAVLWIVLNLRRAR